MKKYSRKRFLELAAISLIFCALAAIIVHNSTCIANSTAFYDFSGCPSINSFFAMVLAYLVIIILSALSYIFSFRNFLKHLGLLLIPVTLTVLMNELATYKLLIYQLYIKYDYGGEIRSFSFIQLILLISALPSIYFSVKSFTFQNENSTKKYNRR